MLASILPFLLTLKAYRLRFSGFVPIFLPTLEPYRTTAIPKNRETFEQIYWNLKKNASIRIIINIDIIQLNFQNF